MRPFTSPAHRRLLALVGATALALSAAAVWASHGGSIIDLTDDEARVEHNDAIFTQGGVGAGTGNFDPYLTLSPGGSSPTEKGYNVCTEPVFGYTNGQIECPDPAFDEQTGGDRTHELLVSSIPVVEVDGALYREFHLDSNDAGSDPWMAITTIELYTETDPDLTFSQFTSTGDLIWDLDGDGDQTILLNTQSLESGSGVSDISILVPDDLFPADCFYGATGCETFLYFYTEAGDPDLELDGEHEGKNWNTTAGFEEWRIELLPVVNVQKTVETAFDRTYSWDVTKSADVESIDLFAGDTATIDWTVTATAGTPADSDVSVTGDIVIQNPTGSGFAISDPIPAVVTDVTDVLTLGGVTDDATVTCPSAFPFTVAAGATVTCTYAYSPADTDSGTNTATVTIETNDEGTTADYSDTEEVDFGDATVNSIDECVEATDDNATPGDTADDLVLDAELCAGDSPGVYEFSTDVGPFDVDDCGQTTVTNTAYTETNDTATTDSASDSVTINCHELSVTKDATPSFSREYDWTVTKSVDPDSLDLFDGDSDDVTWTVTWDRDNGTDSTYAVSGTITITNPAPIAADDVSVADSLTGAVAATVDCDGATAGNQFTVDIAASSSAQCSYSATLPDGTTRTNTATATLFGEDYTGIASVDFTGVNPTEIDATAVVTDDRGPLDEAVSGDGSTTYDETFECGADEGQHDNTAVVTEDDSGETDSDTASVTVNCYELTVTKDAVTSYSRDYDWDIAKTRFIAGGEDDGDGDPLTLTLDEGQSYDVSYEVTVSMTGFTDADHAVAGTITISNPAPMDAEGVSVSDVVSPDIDAIVDCDDATAGDQATVDVPAEGSATCDYSADLPDAEDRTNTATATLLETDYTGTAEVTFDLDNPTVEIDECVDVVDDAGTPGDTGDDIDLGTVCVDDLDANGQWSDEYVQTVGPFAACGEHTFTNTVSFVTTDDENDTDESGSAVYTVTIDVPCPQGCTLTQGYWKTHNDSFWGGAPTDETWELLGDADGDTALEAELETFFKSGGSYFDAMWTAPKGNAYYQLSRQYIAAVLNQLDGAAVPGVVQSAIDDATALFQQYTPAEVAAAKGKNGKELRAQFVELAGILASYNEGDIGPGHCDEDASSTQTGSASWLAIDRRSGSFIG